MPYGLNDAGTVDAEKTWSVNMEFMKELLETAKEYNVTICLENVPFKNFSIASPASVINFVQTINDDNFKICLDTGHAIIFDVNPADAVREFGDTIRTLHIHDNNGLADLHRIPYWGIIDWRAFYSALKETNFKGVFSLETQPSPKLPTPIYKEMCVVINKIIKDIMNEREEIL